jgi:hypothetical protein
MYGQRYSKMGQIWSKWVKAGQMDKLVKKDNMKYVKHNYPIYVFKWVCEKTRYIMIYCDKAVFAG